MPIRKIINRPLNYRKDGVNVAGGISGAIVTNTGEPNSRTSSSVRSHNRVVQRNGQTIVDETTTEIGEEPTIKEVEQ
jgi:hypothetical protein